ncbi:ABC transporter permease [Sinorhizobium meliloti]|uniref:ABC transporter permease n=1 Tax=Rhizobium meliloti TaxID=382 RepID=UPI000FD2F7AE|nr:ABC transporter permease [Sinorhizobium meliloti]MDW9534129.1 ABC transporter permease subunit [Sinorhizobium meliloti]MDW9689680.1 ABC transporter permease subunit [Sinorhizobium meliloti]MDX0134678.1 ABC transporter permease subunit [Sinorhizobium meliloti]RVH15949.1 ABC transporter permease [Sinorhizobium meliloti]RVI75152.1 ABC transporter permease [Sinorhizobium meliloti]
MYVSAIEKAWSILFRITCWAILVFLILPIFVIVPLSFNVEPYFTFTRGMLHFQSEAFSTRWYEAFVSDAGWMLAVSNSFVVGIFSTLLATALGTLAALGLNKPLPMRSMIVSLLLAPMIVPIIVLSAGTYFVFAKVGLVDSYLGLVLAHATLGLPFVVVTVLASLSNFDQGLVRAGLISGAHPTMVFRRITLPLIAPGVLSGAALAFVTSFDEAVITLFLSPSPGYYTVPRKMWSGLREQISPTILAVATIWIALSLVLMILMGVLRRQSAKRSAKPVRLREAPAS